MTATQRLRYRAGSRALLPAQQERVACNRRCRPEHVLERALADDLEVRADLHDRGVPFLVEEEELVPDDDRRGRDGHETAYALLEEQLATLAVPAGQQVVQRDVEQAVGHDR
jgi:hypothetical protein